MTVPYIFQNASTPIPLSQLDQNFTSVAQASNQTYTPPFTNGVPESVSDKLAQTVSVLDFGADPTGTSDSTTAINNALVSGALNVFVPQGTYKVSNSLLVKSNTHFYGSGASSVLNWTGSNVVNVIQNYNFNNSYIGVNPSTADTNIEIDHLTINCLATTIGAGNGGIYFANVIKGFIHNCFITNPGHAGITVAPCTDINIYNNTISGGNVTSANNGISTDNAGSRITISNNILNSIYDSSIGIHNSSTYVTVIGNVINGTVIGQGIDLAGCQKVSVTGNVINGANNISIYAHDQYAISTAYICTEISIVSNIINVAGNHAIEISDSNTGNTYDIAVVGNVIKNSANDGIILALGVKAVNVTGNTINGAITAISLSQLNPYSPSACTISGNSISNSTTGIFLDAQVTGNTIGTNQFSGCATNISLATGQYYSNYMLSNQGVYGQIYALGSVQPQSIPSNAWGIDFTGGLTPTAIVASGTYSFASGSGLIVIHNDSTGDAALFLVYAGSVNKISGATSIVSGTPSTNQIGVYFSTNHYAVTNGYTTTQNVFLSTFRTRTSS